MGPDDHVCVKVIKRAIVNSGWTDSTDLIVIDGGQGQVNVAKEVIQEQLGLDLFHRLDTAKKWQAPDS